MSRLLLRSNSEAINADNCRKKLSEKPVNPLGGEGNILDASPSVCLRVAEAAADKSILDDE